MTLYVSFHGGTGGVNNIYGYDLANPAATPTTLLPETPQLDELRGFALHGTNLYVVNANKSLNQLLIYPTSGLSQSPPTGGSILTSQATVNSIFHPFDLTFDKSNNIYLSSQDSNVVTRMNDQGQALPNAGYLTENYPTGQFLSGTFIASDTGELYGLSSPYPPNVPSHQGLSVSIENGKVANSVRGVLVHKKHIYIADEVANTVNVYSLKKGELKGYLSRKKMKSPVHLKINDGLLYIGAGKSVFTYDLANGVPNGKTKPKKFIDEQLDHVSGMAFNQAGNMYIAERKLQTVIEYDLNGNEIGTALENLPDNPEFIEFLDL